MDKYTTSQISEELGVSRNWINQHLRHLGTRELEEKRDLRIPKLQVMYDYDRVLKWFNDHANFSRQTMFILYSCFGVFSDEEATKILNDIHKQYSSDENRLNLLRALRDFDERAIPEELLKLFDKFDSRNRGNIWVPVEDVQINNFNEIFTMNELLANRNAKSNETVYRDLYLGAAIRVEVFGKVWYKFKEDFEDDFWRYRIPAHLVKKLPCNNAK